MNASRDDIRKYITKQVGRDPHDNFDVIDISPVEIKVRVRFTTKKEDTLFIEIPR